MGIEPTLPCGKGILSPLCLPFHHDGGVAVRQEVAANGSSVANLGMRRVRVRFGAVPAKMDRMRLWRGSNFQEPCITILFIPFILSKEGGGDRVSGWTGWAGWGAAVGGASLLRS